MTQASFNDTDRDTNAAGADTRPDSAVGSDALADPSEEEVLDEINRYMADLLDRTRQRSTSSTASAATPTTPPPATTPPPKPVSERRSDAPRRLQGDRRRAAEEQPAPAEHPKPLRKPSEQQGTDLSAMRQIANRSAQSAISLHESKQVANRARGKLSVAIVAICTAIILFWMDPTYAAATFPAALLAMTIAVIWCGYSVRLFMESRRMVRDTAPEEANEGPTQE